MTNHILLWADGALVYQIYPRSFQDSNGDGIGDLPGITSRLDYLVDLGVTAIWLSPFYTSPMADFGYDVADYCAVDPIFGTIDDFKMLLQSAHAKGLKVMVDFVPNHSSDEHAWFKESSASKDNPKHDWYIWRDGSAKAQPNNWLDVLTGQPAWQWHEGRQQYYLHSFHAKQPDLNWTNPAVRQAMHDNMRFWLDHGVDGFRVDAVYWMAKHPLLADDPADPEYIEGISLPYNKLQHLNSRGWPAVYHYLNEMADVLKEYEQRFMVMEAYPDLYGPLLEYLQFYAAVDPAVAAPFNFQATSSPWQAQPWRDFLEAFHPALEQLSPLCIPSYAFGNHDIARLSSRIGELPARAAAVLLLTLPGMTYLYNGDEIGMTDVRIPADRIQDPAAKGDVVDGTTPGRDPARTPLQWSAGPNAGFSTADTTWLPLALDYATRNVEVQLADPESILNLYRQLTRLRATSPALKHGSGTVLKNDQPDVLVFRRQVDTETYDTYINFAPKATTCTDVAGTVVVSSRGGTAALQDGWLTLRPYEAVILQPGV